MRGVCGVDGRLFRLPSCWPQISVSLDGDGIGGAAKFVYREMGDWHGRTLGTHWWPSR
jgi:hypothetical protein